MAIGKKERRYPGSTSFLGRVYSPFVRFLDLPGVTRFSQKLSYFPGETEAYLHVYKAVAVLPDAVEGVCGRKCLQLQQSPSFSAIPRVHAAPFYAQKARATQSRTLGPTTPYV